MYGPTFPEHLYTVAAQSYGIVDNKTNADTEGNYCDDPLEYTKRFPIEDLTDADVERIMALEEDITSDVPGQLIRIAAYWESTRTCINIPVLPDKLERKGISWKYYALPDKWMNALQAIRHVRFGEMWNKVQDPETILRDLKQDALPAVSRHNHRFVHIHSKYSPQRAQGAQGFRTLVHQPPEAVFEQVHGRA